MEINNTPRSNRIHIGFFGKRNAGKSSLLNAVTDQEIAVVSQVKGTTTDPVYKSMELLPLGPVVIIDTPGFDDEGELGAMRVKRARQVLNKTDIAVLVIDASAGICDTDRRLISLFKEKDIPFITVFNKTDIAEGFTLPENAVAVSTKSREGITPLKERLASLLKSDDGKRLVGDLISAGDTVVLVTPIDSSAPKGRLILPQQQMIRDILDSGGSALTVKETGLADALKNLVSPPKMVITDSQVFKIADQQTPSDIPLTSFSILMARYKGFLESAVRGISAVKKLKNGDRILISEGCTHHRQCGDIGSVKLPKWLAEFAGLSLEIEFSSGTDFPEDLEKYSLIIHCGGCMLNAAEMKYRTGQALKKGVPITNYGTAIAYFNGILPRSLELFPDIAELI